MSYIGEELANGECDVIALTRFDKKLFAGESHLQQACWFDYRYDHPVKRTYHFAHHYMENYRALYQKYIDADADHIHGLSRPKDPLDNSPPVNKTAKLRTPTCLWKARQVCDALCIPYDFYTYNALKKLINERFVKALLSENREQKIRLNIQASGLYSDDVIEHVSRLWKDYQKSRITWSTNPRLTFNTSEMNAESRPHPYKLAYEKYVIKQIITRTVKEFSIANAINKCVLRPAVANKIFGDDMDIAV